MEENCANLIQSHWRKYILQKKIWCMIKPDDPISIMRKAKETDMLNKAWKRIHSDNTFFNSFIVIYNKDLNTPSNVEVCYISLNKYSYYDIINNEIFYMNKKQVLKQLKKISNIITIKIEAVVTEFNIYGYPEIF